MKVVHVLKKIEMIDNDIKELRKLEKSVSKNKSFSTPIYMSIEKQINIMLGERIKLLGLKIENPPEDMVSEFESKAEKSEADSKAKSADDKKAVKTSATKTVKNKKQKKSLVLDDDFDLDDEMPMLTQDLIDQKIKNIKTEKEEKAVKPTKSAKSEKPAAVKKTAVKSQEAAKEVAVDTDDDSVKLLDLALEQGSLGSKDTEKEKKVRFFRENFPVD